MAGVGPYGIEQVNVPGVLAGAQNMQMNRVEMMMEQKKLDMMDRQMSIQSSMMQAGKTFADGLYGNSGVTPASTGSSGAQTAAASYGPSPQQATAAMQTGGTPPSVGPITASNTAAVSAAGQTAPAQAGAPPQSGTMGGSLNMPPQSITSRAAPYLAQMSFLNPEAGEQMANVFSKMDDAQAAQWKARNTAAVQEFAGILQLPYEQRKAAIQANIGDLQRLGYTPQQIAGFDPTDGNIRMEIGKHTDADHVMDMVNPHFENMRQGGAVSETQPYGSSAIVANAPTITGPRGLPYQNPAAVNGTLPMVQTPQDAAKLPPGTKFRMPDGRIGTVPGGAGGNASGNFQQSGQP